MIIKNNTSHEVKFILNGKSIVWASGEEHEIADKDAKMILALTPALAEVKIITSKPEKIEAPKNVKKNKKSK